MPTLPVDRLSLGDSPRLGAVRADHVRALADSPTGWPPIMVQRRTLHVIDGVHRVHAARRRGDTTIAVTFYEGDDRDAFVEAVRANAQHGLALSLAERAAAAARILESHADWSNARVAAVTGVSATTVRTIRACSTTHAAGSNARVGRDGRTRPLDTTAARVLTAQLVRDDPTASVREIARATRLSVSTVWDVRERVRRGEDPVPRRLARGATPVGRMERGRGERATVSRSSVSPSSILHALARDPAWCRTESGRAVLRWLHARIVLADDVTRVANVVPDHSLGVLADLASANASAWETLARRLRERRSAAEQVGHAAS